MELICPVCGQKLTPRQIEDNMCTLCGANLSNYTTMRKHPYQDEPYTTYPTSSIYNRFEHGSRQGGRTNSENLRPCGTINKPNTGITSPPINLSNSLQSADTNPTSKQTQNSKYEIRLFGFARFFRDIFEKEITPVHVIEYISSGKVNINSKNMEKIDKLLTLIQENLLSALSQTFSENKVYVLIYWYGLDGHYPRSIYKIAENVNSSFPEVNDAYHDIIGYLRMSSGRKQWQKICMSALSQIDYSE